MVKHIHQGRCLESNLMPVFIEWQLANIERYQDMFTLIFLDLQPSDRLEDQIRGTDLLFNFPEKEQMVLLLPSVGEKEGQVFLNRLFAIEEFKQARPSAAILEVKHSEASPDMLLEAGINLLQQVMKLSEHPAYRSDRSFAKIAPQQVRLSIIEEDSIVTAVIRRLVERMALEHVEFDINEFHDGQSFIDSGWYQSPQRHIVIVNDVLPKKNGLDILHFLREMPNTKRFTIFMMTKRHSETEMIYAYEHGIDEYMTKPFNPRLFQAQLKKVLNRMYHE